MMMRTRRNRGRAWPLAKARLFAGVLALLLAHPAAAAAQDDCALYISGGSNSPASGRLVGSQPVTISVSIWFGLSFSVSFDVGTYRMHDGTRVRVLCDPQ